MSGSSSVLRLHDKPAVIAGKLTTPFMRAVRTPSNFSDNAQERTQPAAENHPIPNILSVLLPVQSIRRSRMIEEPEYKYLSLRNQSSTVALQQLRYAVISAEYGSFRRAAEALLMRQSTLSRCI